MTTPMIPTADNPERAAATGFDDFVVKFDPADQVKFLRHDGNWAAPPGGGGGSVWGGITGTLSLQTDLQTALNAKANTSSLATVATTGAYSDLLGKPTLGTVAALSYPGGTSNFLRADGTFAIPQDVFAAWGNISGTLSSQTDLNTALGAKAPLASPTFTGTPAGPTAAANTNTTQFATTAYYINQAFSGTPAMNGAGASGTAFTFARGDHVHPSDTGRLANVLTTTGDLPYASSGATAGRLPIGSNGQFLSVVTGAPAWVTFAGLANPMTTSQDIIVGGAAGAPARLAVGANGTFLGVVAGSIVWTTPSGSGDVVGPASSVSGRVATFNGTTGKLIQDGGTLLSALATLASPALTGTPTAPTATALSNNTTIATTAYVDTADALKAPLASPALTGNPTAPTAAQGDNDTSIATTAFVQQEKTINVQSKSAAYTGVLADANTALLHPSADTTARVFTIPANSSVAYPVGTTLTFVNQNSAGVVTIAITTDTMRLAGAGTTGSRTLAANGIATAVKITSTEWIINGTGLT